MGHEIIERIFRSYDIRGIYPHEINKEAAFIIGQAFVRFIDGKKICLGYDARTSSPELSQAFAEGAKSQGAEVVDLGLLPSEVVYFAVGKYSYDGGAVITASHNPKEYNGIRLVDENVEMIPGKKIYEFIQHNKIPEFDKNRGGIGKKDVVKDYIRHVLSFVDIKKLRPLKIVIDAGNGVAGVILPRLLEKLPFIYTALFFKPDGAFPNHPSNPLLPESQEALRKKVLEEKADLGIIFDGDGDRVLLMTEAGEFLKGDISLALMAKYLLQKEPGAAISYTVICSRIVSEKIKGWGGQPVKTPVGFVNVSGGIRKHNGVMGGETSAHYCFRDNFYADSGMIALMLLLGILSESDMKLSELVKEFQKYIRKEVYFESDKVAETIAVLKKRYKNCKQDEMDGLTVDHHEWWFNARASNTEPLLRLTVEAENEKLLDSKIIELTKIIKNL